MTSQTKLCLNMIVRNEVNNLQRSLPTFLPWISSYCIVDTGSTDGTPEYVEGFLSELNFVPGHIFHEPFENFEQARNIALDHARHYMRGAHDYLLLADADMDLVVDDPHCFEGLTAPVYLIEQRAGGLSYWNARLLRADVAAKYVGVTHEYLDFGSGEVRLQGCWFNDRASGSNRVNKVARDIVLLEKSLLDDPTNVRTMFYLAQSYAEVGSHETAIELFEKRAAAGGWEEEVFMSLLRAGREYKALGRDADFIRSMIAAYNARPIRAEPLYELSTYYRQRGDNCASNIFSENGMMITKPNDILFLEDKAYDYGFREDFSISGFYEARTRTKAFSVCNALALDRSVPEETRALARSNLYHYLQPLKTYAKSWEASRLVVTVPDGYVAMNPSVTWFRDRVWVLVRTVNYRITESGHYDMRGDTAIRTRNLLMPLFPNLLVDFKADDPIQHPDDPDRFGPLPVEITHSNSWPSVPAYPLVIGFEDMRLYPHKDTLWANACVRELTTEGWCEQILVRLAKTGRVMNWEPMRPVEVERTTEKNWAPIIDHPSGQLAFMYRPGTVINPDGEFLQSHTPRLAIDHFSGGSQLIPFNGGWLTVIHEAFQTPGSGLRSYQHRFVWYSHDLLPTMISKPFVFNERQIEFCAGLCRINDNGKLVLSYGVRDREAWIGTIDWHDVWEMLNDH